MPGVEVITSIIINRPKSEVSAYAANPDNAPEWYKNINSITWESNPEIAIGSRMAFRAKFLGKDLAYVYEIIELEDASKMVMSTYDGPFPMETTYLWEDVENGGTKMTLINRGRPKGFSKVLAPFMKAAMRKANNNDLKLLKQILES